jgi:hypothetical protein
MSSRIHIEYCNSEKQLAEAIAFSDAVGHTFHPGIEPVRMIRRDDKLIAIAQEFRFPSQLVGFAKDVRARDFVDSCNAIRLAGEASTVGGNVYALFGHSDISDESLAVINFKDTGYRLFRSAPPPHQ